MKNKIGEPERKERKKIWKLGYKWNWNQFLVLGSQNNQEIPTEVLNQNANLNLTKKQILGQLGFSPRRRFEIENLQGIRALLKVNNQK